MATGLMRLIQAMSGNENSDLLRILAGRIAERKGQVLPSQYTGAGRTARNPEGNVSWWPILETAGEERLKREPEILETGQVDPLTGSSGAHFGGGVEGLLDIYNKGRSSEDPNFVTEEGVFTAGVPVEASPEGRKYIIQGASNDASKGMPSDLTDVEGIIRVLNDPSSTPEAFRSAYLAKQSLVQGKQMPFQEIPDGWKSENPLPLPYMRYAEAEPFPAINKEQHEKALAAERSKEHRLDWEKAEASGTLSDIFRSSELQDLIDQGNPEILYRLAQHSEQGRARFDMEATTAALTKRLELDEDWKPGQAWEDIPPDQLPVAEDFTFRKGFNKPGSRQKFFTSDGPKSGTYIFTPDPTSSNPTEVLLKLSPANVKVVDSAFDSSTDEIRDRVLREALMGTGDGADNKAQIRALRENFTPSRHIQPVKRNKSGKPIEGHGLTAEEAQEAWDDPMNMVGTFNYNDVEANFVAAEVKQYFRWKYGENGLDKTGHSFDSYDTPMVAHIVQAANNAAEARQNSALIDRPEAWYNFGNTFHTFRNVWGDSPAGIEAGQARLLDYINMIGATTANSKPHANLRSASWYDYVFSSRGTFGGTLRRGGHAVFREIDPNSTRVDFGDVPDNLKGEYQDEYSQVVINSLFNRVEWKTVQEFYAGNFDSGKAYIGRDAELRGPEASVADQEKRAASLKFFRNSDKVGNERTQAPAGTFDKFLKKLHQNYKAALPDKSDKIIAARVKLFEQKSYINPYWTLPKSIEMGEQPWIATFKDEAVHKRQRPGTDVDATDPRRMELEASQRPQDAAIRAEVKTLESLLGEDYSKTEKVLASLQGNIDKIYRVDEKAAIAKLKKAKAAQNGKEITRLEKKLESYRLKRDELSSESEAEGLAWPKLEGDAGEKTKGTLKSLNSSLKTSLARREKMIAAGAGTEGDISVGLWPNTKKTSWPDEDNKWHNKILSTKKTLRKVTGEREKNVLIDDPLSAVVTDKDGVPLYSLSRDQAEAAQRIREGRSGGEDLKALEASIKANSGVTYDIVTSAQKSQGYAVAPFKSTEVGIPEADFSYKDIEAYIDKWEQVLNIPGAHYGVWFKEETGEYMQDVSIVVKNEIIAAGIGRAGKQDSFVSLHEDFKEFKLMGEGEKYGKDTQELIGAERDFVNSEWAGVLREAEDRVLRGVQGPDQAALSKARYAQNPLEVTESVEKSALAPPYGGGQYYQTWQRVMDKPEEQANFYRDLTRAAYRHIKDKNMAALNWPSYFRVDPLEAQKSGHFIGNVAGEALTATLDKVMSNMFLMRGGTGKRLDAPETGSYVLYDEFLREIAKGYDMLPAEFQAAAWLGSGDKMQHAGVGSSAARILQERFKITAALLNRFTPADKKRVTPDMVRILWAKGAFPLFTFAAAQILGVRGDESPFDRDREGL